MRKRSGCHIECCRTKCRFFSRVTSIRRSGIFFKFERSDVLRWESLTLCDILPVSNSHVESEYEKSRAAWKENDLATLFLVCCLSTEVLLW
jgi:hypothetical protein